MTDFYSKEDKINTQSAPFTSTLPLFARSSLNRCNLPAIILGSHLYQQHPVPLHIDCVDILHREFFHALEDIEGPEVRALHFRQYMCSAFLLGQSEQAGFTPEGGAIRGDKLDYLRLLRGWMFNSDSIEGAVMKRWVESRFGLQALNHHGFLENSSSPAYSAYQADYVRGLYNSNALESQLDLLYSFCQYELQRRWPDRSHWHLFRGVNQMSKHHQIKKLAGQQQLLLFNNLNSFSDDQYLAETFGDVILKAAIPSTKLLFFPGLLTGVLKGESEYLVVGGIYQSTVIR